LNNRLEYLKCPIHEAAEKAFLKILLLMLRKRVYMLEKSDGFGYDATETAEYYLE